MKYDLKSIMLRAWITAKAESMKMIQPNAYSILKKEEDQ